jgi:anhydro-N-acetylmuramic acid kinase
MASILRFDGSPPGEGRRWLAGVMVSSLGDRADAALVGVLGRGLEARAELAAALSAEIPRETAALLRPLLEGAAVPAATLAAAQAQLAEVEAVLLGDLLAQAPPPAGVLAAGIHDPGFWAFKRPPAAAGHPGHGEPAGYLGCCDAARLAELTGLNVLDAFPARDLAAGGLGGPLLALPEWLLLRQRRRSRVLLDLGRAARLTCLPAQASDRAAAGIRSFDVGPGTALLDLLAQRLSAGQHRFDPGGRMAVQGRRLGPLVDRWLADPCFHSPLPRWRPRGVRPERFLADALQMAVDSGWSVRDLLCTATHFIAETVALALRKGLPEDAAVDEILVAGGGRHNGMLLGEIARLAELPVVQIEETSIPSEALGPACVALLAMLHLDGVAANPTAITGASTPRILGRLTPGSPQNWQLLLQACGAVAAAVRPLRSAV